MKKLIIRLQCGLMFLYIISTTSCMVQARVGYRYNYGYQQHQYRPPIVVKQACNCCHGGHHKQTNGTSRPRK